MRSSMLSPRVADPYITAMNAMPRAIRAPIFAVWFGLGITSKVVFGITPVFFIVFFATPHGRPTVSALN
jgi:NitT/TauT family transport system permease protein